MYRATITVLTLLLCLASAGSALAIPAFNKVFVEEYVKEHKDPEYSQLVMKKVRCLVCHQGKKKEHRNPYGKHLVKLLDKKTDKDNVEKIRAALEKVGKMHSDPKDEKSPTYAELIAASKLPGGKLEDLQKEPPNEDKEGHDGDHEHEHDDGDQKGDDGHAGEPAE